MFFVELDDADVTLADIKRIAQHIADDYEHLVGQLTEAELEDLSFILKPTLEADHNEFEIRQRWKKFFDEFVLKNDEGMPMKFFYGEDGHLYFGDKDGMAMANKLSHGGDYPQKVFRG